MKFAYRRWIDGRRVHTIFDPLIHARIIFWQSSTKYKIEFQNANIFILLEYYETHGGLEQGLIERHSIFYNLAGGTILIFSFLLSYHITLKTYKFRHRE